MDKELYHPQDPAYDQGYTEEERLDSIDWDWLNDLDKEEL